MNLFFNSLCCFFLICLFFSCSNNQETLTTQADLRWTGPLAADGCGFFLDIDGQEHKPANEEVIPDRFKDEKVHQVQLRYELLEEPVAYSCGMLPTHYKSSIKILEITPR